MFLQIEDMKHIDWDSCSDASVIHKRWELGAPGCPGLFLFEHSHVTYQIDGDDEQNRLQVKFSPCG